MEQQYILKYHGGYDLFEQNQMSGEERQWIIKRINKQKSEEKEAANSSMPSMPRVPRR